MDDHTPFQPTLADCASGKLNAQTLHCTGHSRSMSYAACLARLKANDNKERDLPADWSECAQHRRSGNCNASKMRDEEIGACKPLYFVKRGVTDLVQAAVKWVSSPKKSAAPSRGSSALDHLPKVDYAAAINAAAAQPAIRPPSSIQPAMQALPGESPLQMARRIFAQRAAQSTTTP